MSGGKGGSTTSSVTIPEYIEEAARRNLAKAEGISQIGYVPYFGPDVAAFTPFQQAGFQQTADVASAFGLGTPTAQADIMGGMPEPTQFAGGVRGYSAAPLYQQAVDELAAQRPAQAQYIESFFIDPVTGQAGTRVQPAVDYSTMGTMADIRAADRANELAIAQAQAAAGPESVYNFTPSTEVLVGPTSVGVGGTTVGGQEVQYYNPDIDYGDAFTAESGQQVGVLDPNQAALDAMQTEAGVDPSFYTETPIYSASDFPLGSSLSGTDYTSYAPDADESSYATNEFGSTVSAGYDIGQVDPRLAAAEGYSPVGVATPEIDYGAYLTPVSQPTTSDPLYDALGAANQAAYSPSPNAQASTVITNPAEGITDTSEASMGQQVMSDIEGGLIGLAANTLLGQILLDDSYQVGGVNNPIENPTVAEMIAAAPPNMVYDASTGAYLASSNDNDTPIISTPASDSGNFLSGGGADGVGDFGAVGDFFGSIGDALGITDYAGEAEELTGTPAAAIAPPVRPTSSDSGGGGGGGGGLDTVLCSAYYSLGYLPREIWRLDQRYGVWLHRNDPELMEGYHAWAAPLAEYIQKDTRGAKVARAVMWPIVKAWAAEMAHRQRPEKHKPNVVGKIIMAVGEPFSRVCGMLKPRAIRGEA
jgi:hypothetical protein